jgi:hypothetical protein
MGTDARVALGQQYHGVADSSLRQSPVRPPLLSCDSKTRGSRDSRRFESKTFVVAKLASFALFV